MHTMQKDLESCLSRTGLFFSRGDFEGERRSHCWKAAGTHGNSVPIVKVFKNAQERNAAVKDKETFIAQSSMQLPSLHFYLHFSSDNTIREN